MNELKFKNNRVKIINIFEYKNFTISFCKQHTYTNHTFTNTPLRFFSLFDVVKYKIFNADKYFDFKRRRKKNNL